MVTMKNYRWVIVALLFFATSINYIDRQVIGLLKPVLEKQFNWDDRTFGYINSIFQLFYAGGLLVFGYVIDKIGTKLGYAISVLIWSLAAMAHALSGSTVGFAAARAVLGIGESGNFPAAIKSVAEWFPKKERSFATGLFNSGTNIGAVIAPIMVPWILGIWGWRQAFLITGSLGFIWLIAWYIFYDIPSKQKRLSSKEYEYIHSDDLQTNGKFDPSPVPWKKLFIFRQTWAFLVGKFLTDPIWWFFLLWLPDYFSGTFQLDLRKPGWPLVIVYTSTSLGSIGGGYLSSYLIKKGWSVPKARKTAMLIFAFAVLPVVTARYATNMWTAVALISLAASAHQAWSATIFTTASDIFPKKAVSSVVGIGGMAGSVGGIIFPIIVGNILNYFKLLGNKTAGYNIIFTICGCAYLVAWLIMHFLMPDMKQADLSLIRKKTVSDHPFPE
jgi:ACS family hexuronate transporter-like MFS transporter